MKSGLKVQGRLYEIPYIGFERNVLLFYNHARRHQNLYLGLHKKNQIRNKGICSIVQHHLEFLKGF